MITGTVMGGNNDIWIYVKEHGQLVKDFGKVKNPVNVVFTAPEKGNYSLYVSNEISLMTSKSIDLDVIFKRYDYGPGASLLVMGIVLILSDILLLAFGQKRLVIKIGDETYEFWPSWKGLNVAVNSVTLNEKLKPGMKFKVGPNDEHLLEIQLLQGRFGSLKYGVFVDSQEVGRLP